MKKLPFQITHYVVAGSKTNFDIAESESLVKTRAMVGISIGILIGAQFSPEIMITGALVGFSLGVACGIFEHWAWHG